MLFKKNKPSSPTDTQTNAQTTVHQISPDIEAVLTREIVAGKSLSTMIARIERHGQGNKQTGDTLTLDIDLPDTVTNDDAEALHARLGQALYPYGIRELNFNIRLVSASGENTPNQSAQPNKPNLTRTKLPKVTDAMSEASAKPSQTNQPTRPPQSQVQAQSQAKTPPKQSDLQPHPRIKHIIVVASGKGGVGKSTTTVNLALALQKLGNQVGVLDADIYGPSIPTMLGVAGVKPTLENEQFVPIDAHGLAMLSIGSLIEGDNTPVAWRGPKATGALMQLFNQTNWATLDYLLIDMPPGTGDIQLTLAQRIPVTGAVIVTTPQHIALLDAQKGIEMFKKTNIPVLGIVENMALHTCSNCGHTEAIFGQGGGEQISQTYGVPLLGQLPLASQIREQADNGLPSVIAGEGDRVGQGDDFAPFYMDIANNIEANIAKFTKVRDDGRIF